MTDSNSDKDKRRQAREERLAQNLRDNLRRRKAATRKTRAPKTDKPVADKPVTGAPESP